jgi:hypothetical protein
MRRRGVAFTEARRRVYNSVYEQTEAQRREVLFEIAAPRLAKSA